MDKRPLPKEFEGKKDLLEKIKYILAPLSKSKAFIAGGCPLGLVTGKEFNDIDVYFTCLSKLKRKEFLREQFAGSKINVLPSDSDGDYGIMEDRELVGSCVYEDQKFQFIWVKSFQTLGTIEFMDHVLSKFDIDLCKVGLYFIDDYPRFYKTIKHDTDLTKKQLMLNIGFNPIQTQRTLEIRLPKYLGRFPKFKVEINEVPPNKSNKKLKKSSLFWEPTTPPTTRELRYARAIPIPPRDPFDAVGPAPTDIETVQDRALRFTDLDRRIREFRINLEIPGVFTGGEENDE